MKHTIKHLIGLFPTPLAIIEGVDCGDEIRKFLNEEEIHEENVDSTNYLMRGRISKTRYVLAQPKYEVFLNILEEYITEFATEIECLNIEKMQITQSWVSVKKPGQHHAKHSHGNSIISGVYYFGDNSFNSAITFHKNYNQTNTNNLFVPQNNEKAGGSEYAWNAYTINPTKDTLILFPSHLAHSVATNETNSDRKCIAFNSLPIKKLGSYLDSTEIFYENLK